MGLGLTRLGRTLAEERVLPGLRELPGVVREGIAARRFAVPRMVVPEGPRILTIGSDRARSPVGLVLLGDSLLFSAGVHRVEDGLGPQFATHLAELAGAPVQVHRHAVIGAKTRDLSAQISGAGDALRGAQHVLVSIGGNDATSLSHPAAVRDALAGALATLRSNAPEAQITLLGIPDTRNATVLGRDLASWVGRRADDLREGQSAVAATLDARVTFVDTPRVVNAHLIGDASMVSPDGFHPSADGYRRSADLVFTDLTQRGAI